MRIFVVFLITVAVAASYENQNDDVKCEPVGGKFKTAHHYAKRHTMFLTDIHFTLQKFHSAKQILTDRRPGNALRVWNAEDVPAYIHIFYLEKSNHIERYRRADYSAIFNFYHGDTAVCHQFNPKTREYTKTQIGFHTNNFICIYHPGNFFTVAFEKHREEKFAFIGVTLIYGNGNGTLDFFSMKNMIEMFPEHSTII